MIAENSKSAIAQRCDYCAEAGAWRNNIARISHQSLPRCGTQ
jgi:hypothetical protein